MKKNVLIFPIGTEIGLEIHRALKYSKHFELFGASSDNNNHGKFVCKNYLELPKLSDNDFVEKLDVLINKYKIDFIYPASPLIFDYVQFWPKSIRDISILPSVSTCQICRSKRELYSLFNEILRVPLVYSDWFDFIYHIPLFIKPNKGEGSKNNQNINPFLKLDHLNTNFDHLIVK